MCCYCYVTHIGITTHNRIDFSFKCKFFFGLYACILYTYTWLECIDLSEIRRQIWCGNEMTHFNSLLKVFRDFGYPGVPGFRVPGFRVPGFRGLRFHVSSIPRCQIPGIWVLGFRVYDFGYPGFLSPGYPDIIISDFDIHINANCWNSDYRITVTMY